MLGFRRRQSLERFASAHSSVFNHFTKDRHLNRRDVFKARRDAALAEWRERGAAWPRRSASSRDWFAFV
jgi:putative transposase